MKIKFTKYHGIGNDFIIIDCRNTDIEYLFTNKNLIIKLCNRNYGIGADGIILALKPNDIGDIKMKIINSDGTEPEMCGNGIRCLIKYLYDNDSDKNHQIYNVETKAGILPAQISDNNEISIEMGKPCFIPNSIPTTLKKSHIGIPQGTININQHNINVSAVSMGNPHMVIIVEKLDSIPFESWGKILENHSTFPNKANVHFVEIIDKGNIRVKVWERSCGPTLACGTGACASLAVAFKLGYTNTQANVILPGGKLNISWPKEDSSIIMQGEAKYVYKGTFDINDYSFV